ncbi:DNA polymerase Y family protein [Kordiimonas sp. SCSIO 12603]|uniref:Y-family DNA polymerase n=1 Tax=Kordiimonas sp. SCSIO 12603 TaxID=2829596 RepID=UPI00210225E2|nr:DNA polymerase Y family protein [Kordiimonas sp. SCSIO 12603]UTW58830.1 DNA polymerase Y family protein [Kordiimonas sp. SCSIO 12603]
MRRIISIWLPLWPIDQWRRSHRLHKQPFDKPFALTASERQTQTLYAVCPAAHKIGLRIGMTLAEARAIHPVLQVAPSTPKADQQKLEDLTRWFIRYTPLVAVDGDDGILLDVTGCTHLFGGEEAMLDSIKTRLRNSGINSQISMAENRRMAWAFSHYKPGTISENPIESRAILSNLTMAALQLDDGMQQMLFKLGLKKTGQLFDLPRASLMQRFRGKNSKKIEALITRMDQAEGRRNEPIIPFTLLPEWQVRMAFSEPLQLQEMVGTAIKELLLELTGLLAEADKGVMRLALYGFRVDGSVQKLMIGTNKPSRDQKHLMRLLEEKLPDLEAEFGFDLLLLSAEETAHLPPEQTSSAKAHAEHSVTEFLDRIGARLGPSSVRKIKHRHSYIPEQAQIFTSLQTNELHWEEYLSTLPIRPIRLLLRPEAIHVLAEVPEGAPKRFRWRRVEHLVTKAEGPERIAPEWWINSEDPTRDYYQVEVKSGARLWLFRSGLYAIKGVRPSENRKQSTQPQWFMHGFFA